MNSLRKKASRLFGTQTNASVSTTTGHDIDSGVGSPTLRLKTKSSRFFSRKNDDDLPPIPTIQPPPSSPGSLSTPVSPTSVYTVFEEDENQNTNSTLQVPKASPKLKASPSLRSLKRKSSNFFRKNQSSETLSPSPPPIPTVPQESQKLKRRRPAITPLNLVRSSFVSKSNLKTQNRSISSPKPSPAMFSPLPDNPVTLPVSKPAGGTTPSRPPRPSSLDEDTLAVMRERVTRMCLPNSKRVSSSTTTTTTSSTTPRSDVSSIEVRLGFPTGNGIPSPSLESPLAAHFCLESTRPLPIRDSNGSIKGYSRFSEFIRAQHSSSYSYDSLDKEDRDTTPVELYRVEKEGDWIMERRVSKGPNGNPGRLFRDRWGGFHFVPDF